MKSLRDALRGWEPPAGAVGGEPLAALRASWSDIVGAEIAKNSFPSDVDRDALIVTVRSGAWSQQLTYLSDRIVERLSAAAPSVTRVRFRVGRLPTRSAAPGVVRRASRRTVAPRPPSVDAVDAVARFRADTEALRRAKREAGWNICSTCGVWIAPRAGTLCVACADARDDVRAEAVARLLYETPWLGFAGVASAITDLKRDEYERIRARLLARWWGVLRRAQRAGRLSRDRHERAIADSYVLLKSGIAPDRIVPATIRNLLGDELHELLYGTD